MMALLPLLGANAHNVFLIALLVGTFSVTVFFSWALSRIEGW